VPSDGSSRQSSSPLPRLQTPADSLPASVNPPTTKTRPSKAAAPAWCNGVGSFGPLRHAPDARSNTSTRSVADPSARNPPSTMIVSPSRAAATSVRASGTGAAVVCEGSRSGASTDWSSPREQADSTSSRAKVTEDRRTSRIFHLRLG
jgi:hypothetical protein